jgi:hypothetical protein
VKKKNICDADQMFFKYFFGIFILLQIISKSIFNENKSKFKFKIAGMFILKRGKYLFCYFVEEN